MDKIEIFYNELMKPENLESRKQKNGAIKFRSENDFSMYLLKGIIATGKAEKE